ncbi:MAG: SPOR domain-containing protein [Sphingomonas fennica]
MAEPIGPGDDDLRWAEERPAVDYDREHGFGRMARTLLTLLAGVAIASLVIWWFALRDGSLFGAGRLIKAPAGSYRERPAEAGGMQVEGTGDLSYGASEGIDVDSAIDLDAMPEAPITANATAPIVMPQALPGGGTTPALPAPGTPPAAALAPAPAATPAPAEPPAATRGTIQLGAFSQKAKAQAAWKSLSGRFAFLAPLESTVLEVKGDGKTVYRLRAAAGAEAAGICRKLTVAGETCSVVG